MTASPEPLSLILAASPAASSWDDGSIPAPSSSTNALKSLLRPQQQKQRRRQGFPGLRKKRNVGLTCGASCYVSGLLLCFTPRADISCTDHTDRTDHLQIIPTSSSRYFKADTLSILYELAHVTGWVSNNPHNLRLSACFLGWVCTMKILHNVS